MQFVLGDNLGLFQQPQTYYLVQNVDNNSQNATEEMHFSSDEVALQNESPELEYTNYQKDQQTNFAVKTEETVDDKMKTLEEIKILNNESLKAEMDKIMLSMVGVKEEASTLEEVATDDENGYKTEANDTQDGTLPEGWSVSPGGLVCPPPSLLLQFPSRRAAYQALALSACPPTAAQHMFDQLAHEGWRASPLLPQGWIYREEAQGLAFLSKAGRFFESVEAMVAVLRVEGVGEEEVQGVLSLHSQTCQPEPVQLTPAASPQPESQPARPPARSQNLLITRVVKASQQLQQIPASQLQVAQASQSIQPAGQPGQPTEIRISPPTLGGVQAPRTIRLQAPRSLE